MNKDFTAWCKWRSFFKYFVFFSYLEMHLCSGALEWSEEPVYDVHYDKISIDEQEALMSVCTLIQTLSCPPEHIRISIS